MLFFLWSGLAMVLKQWFLINFGSRHTKKSLNFSRYIATYLKILDNFEKFQKTLILNFKCFWNFHGTPEWVLMHTDLGKLL